MAFMKRFLRRSRCEARKTADTTQGVGRMNHGKHAAGRSLRKSVASMHDCGHPVRPGTSPAKEKSGDGGTQMIVARGHTDGSGRNSEAERRSSHRRQIQRLQLERRHVDASAVATACTRMPAAFGSSLGNTGGLARYRSLRLIGCCACIRHGCDDGRQNHKRVGRACCSEARFHHHQANEQQCHDAQVASQTTEHGG